MNPILSLEHLKLSLILSVLMFATFLVATVQASENKDWPMFRHDNEHSGTSDEFIAAPLDLLLDIWVKHTLSPM